MAFSQNEASTSNKLAKHKPATYLVYLFELEGLKREQIQNYQVLF